MVQKDLNFEILERLDRQPFSTLSRPNWSPRFDVIDLEEVAINRTFDGWSNDGLLNVELSLGSSSSRIARFITNRSFTEKVCSNGATFCPERSKQPHRPCNPPRNWIRIKTANYTLKPKRFHRTYRFYILIIVCFSILLDSLRLSSKKPVSFA